MRTNLDWLKHPAKNLDEAARSAAQTRQLQLTKPPGALGQLESLAIRLAAMQGCEKPQIDKVFISVFAGDHGIAEENVSAFPQTRHRRNGEKFCPWRRRHLRTGQAD